MSRATPHNFVYLASQSPRRQQLLDQLGVKHRLLLPLNDEDAEALEVHHLGESPADYVQRVTDLKLQAALKRLRRLGWPKAPVLCADTTVALGRRILGKPESAADAAQMLARLSGRQHRVLTAVAVGSGRVRHAALSVSQVHFTELKPAQIRAYVATGEPMGKAGSYAIQSQAAQWISRISGSYSGIMGLPLFEVGVLLRRIGVRF